MKTLADRIFEIIPKNKRGISLREAAKATRQSTQHVRAAFDKLSESGRAVLVRRGKGRTGTLYAAHVDQGVRACVICQKEIHPVRKTTKTCSHSCGRFLMYSDPVKRAQHKAATTRAARRPQRRALQRKLSRKRGADPVHRAKLSENNRRSWADPIKRAKRVVGIKKAWDGARGAARRKGLSKKKKALWNDPEWRARSMEAMRASKRGRFKRAVLELAHITPPLPEEEIALRAGLTLEQTKTIIRRAYHDGELARKPHDRRKDPAVHALGWAKRRQYAEGAPA